MITAHEHTENKYKFYKRILKLYLLGIPVSKPYGELYGILFDFFEIDETKTILRKILANEYFNKDGEQLFKIRYVAGRHKIELEGFYLKFLNTIQHKFKDWLNTNSKTVNIIIMSQLVLVKKGFQFDFFYYAYTKHLNSDSFMYENSYVYPFLKELNS